MTEKTLVDETNQISDLLNNLEESEDSIDKTLMNESSLHPFSPKWTDHVMSLFEKNELINDKPTCDGLRRVFQNVMGPIIKTKVDIIKAPTLADMSCTCIVQIEYFNKYTSQFTSRADVFDINRFNTPTAPFHYLATSVAVTRAEARCLRKEMNLIKILSIEESIGNCDSEGETPQTDSLQEPAKETMKTLIRNMAIELNIDLNKLMELLNISTSMESLTIGMGRTIHSKLNDYQRYSMGYGGEEIPDNIKKASLTI